jgi:hypothetical protein
MTRRGDHRLSDNTTSGRRIRSEQPAVTPDPEGRPARPRTADGVIRSPALSERRKASRRRSDRRRKFFGVEDEPVRGYANSLPCHLPRRCTKFAASRSDKIHEPLLISWADPSKGPIDPYSHARRRRFERGRSAERRESGWLRVPMAVGTEANTEYRRVWPNANCCREAGRRRRGRQV